MSHFSWFNVWCFHLAWLSIYMANIWIPIFFSPDILISISNAVIILLIIWTSKRQIQVKALLICLETSTDGSPGSTGEKCGWLSGMLESLPPSPALPSQPILGSKIPKITVRKLLCCEILCYSMWVPERWGPSKVVSQGKNMKRTLSGTPLWVEWGNSPKFAPLHLGLDHYDALET